MRTLSKLALMMFMLASFECYALDYQTPAKTKEDKLWSNEGSKVLCKLTQNIEGWGDVTYFMEANKKTRLELLLTPYRAFDKVSTVTLYDTPPNWFPGKAERKLNEAKLFRGFDGYLNGTDAWYTLSALEKGHMVVFSYHDSSYSEDEIRVLLNPFSIKTPFKDFINCTKELLDYGYQDIRFTVIHFEDKTNKLTPFSSKRLEQIANYILEDKNFSEISVTVHTDTFGDKEENQKVTDEQAKVIKDFFISKGVDENKLFIKSMGQEDPAVDNLNNDKSLINRRVLIQIVDENNR